MLRALALALVLPHALAAAASGAADKQAVPYPLLRGPFVCEQREVDVGRETRGLRYPAYVLTPLQTPALTPLERATSAAGIPQASSVVYERYAMPVVVFAAGLMADILSVRRGGYITTLDALCSHGFVVIASRAGVQVTGQTLADGEDTPVDEHLLELLLWLAGAKRSTTWGGFANVTAEEFFGPYGGLDLDRVGLMGHSLGSAQAQRIVAAAKGKGPAAHFFDGSTPGARPINIRTLVMLGPVCGALQDCCFTGQRCGNPRWARQGKNRVSMVDEETGCASYLCSSDPATPHRYSVPYLLTSKEDYEAYDGSLLVVVGTEDKRAHPFAGLEVWRHAPNATTRALALLGGGTHCFVDVNPFALAFREVNECGYNVLSWTDQIMHTQQLVNSWFLTYLAQYPQPIAMRYLDSLPNRRLSRPQTLLQPGNEYAWDPTPSNPNADFASAVALYHATNLRTAEIAAANANLPPPAAWEIEVSDVHNDEIDMNSLMFEGAALSMLYGEGGLWRAAPLTGDSRRSDEASAFTAMAMRGLAKASKADDSEVPSNVRLGDRDVGELSEQLADFVASTHSSVMRGVLQQAWSG